MFVNDKKITNMSTKEIKDMFILYLIELVIAGVLIYLGLRSELLFVRILSFIFVFVIFTFMLLFVLVAHALQSTAA